MAKRQKQEEPETNIEYPYTVESLAERLEIEPATVRVRLRNAEIPKAGKMYGWKTKREFEEVVKELEATPATTNGSGSKTTRKAKKEPDPPPKAAKKTLKRKAKSGDEATA